MKSIVGQAKKIVNKILGRYKQAQRYQQLFDVIREIRPKTIMEIGTWSGSRAKEMIRLAQSLRPGEQISYYGFDLFEDLTPELYAKEISKHPPSMAEVEKHLAATGAAIKLYKGNTMQTLSHSVAALPPMDFIYIDGGHSLQTIANDWRYSSEVLANNGITIFDDYWPDRTDAGCKPTVDAISRDSFSVSIMPIVDVFKNPDHGRLTIQFARVSKRIS